jgi:uncharacterized damage-inducible protein DinB
MAQQELNRLIAEIQAQRERAMALLSTLTDEQLDLAFETEEATEEGPFTIRRLLHRITTHHKDHLRHLLKARQGIGSPRSELARILAEMQAARAELVASLIGLSDEDLDKPWQEGEWTVRQIVLHIVEMENMRLSHIQQALGSRPS